MLGNDDPAELRAILDEATWGTHGRGQVVLLDDDHEMISWGYSNITPWHSHREQTEDAAGAVDRGDGRRAPRPGTGDRQHPRAAVSRQRPRRRPDARRPTRPSRRSLGQVKFAPAGSTAVRDAIAAHPAAARPARPHPRVGRDPPASAGRSPSTPAPTTGPAPSTAPSSRSSATRSRRTSSCAVEPWPAASTPPGEVLVAIDVGTSGARAAAFDLEGRRLLTRSAAATRPRAPRRAGPSRTAAPGAPRRSRRWPSSFGRLERPAWSSRDVRAIWLTGQCPSVVLVDRRGRPARTGLIYRDNRAIRRGASRSASGSATRRSMRGPGTCPSGFHIAPKLLWLRPPRSGGLGPGGARAPAARLVVLALTGEAATDGTHAAATLVYDLRAGGWDAACSTTWTFPPRLIPGSVGRARWSAAFADRVARRVGLAAGLPVVLGGADSQACALGAGVVGPGPVCEMAGSSTCLNAAVAAPLDVLSRHPLPARRRPGVHDRDGPQHDGCGGRLGGRPALRRAAGVRIAERLRTARSEAGGRPAGRRRRRCPWRSSATASGPIPACAARSPGLSLRHGRAAIARAVLEGVAFAIRRPARPAPVRRRAGHRAAGLGRRHSPGRLERRSRPT